MALVLGRRKARGLFAAFLLLLSWTLPAKILIGHADGRPLADAVHDYLITEDADRAEALFDEVIRHPDASLSTVESLLKQRGSFPKQPVGVLAGRGVLVRGRLFQYGLYVPPTYDPAKAYALVLCLHGAGFTGDAYLERWQARLTDDYILACPTLPQGTWWTRQASDLVLATIADVIRRYHIDSNRIFLTGMSNGGIGAYLIGTHYAALFAGLAPMASGLDSVLLPLLENLRHTPVYILHGARDQVMPVELSRTIARELTRLGYPFIYREHDRSHPIAGGHFFPREELPDLVAWLGHQRRNPLPKRLTVVRDATHLVPFGWVRIDATEPIAAFTDALIDSQDQAIIDRVYAKLDVEITGPNRIEVRSQHVKRVALFLNRALVDFDQPVMIVVNGRLAFEGLVTPSLETLLRDARHRRDPAMLFPVLLTIPIEDGT